MTSRVAVVALGCAALACRAPARASGAASDSTLGTPVNDSSAQAATRFTQDFYDWYGRHNDRMDAALSEHAAWFSPALVTMLRADSAAQAANPDEVVGLDWDPFTASQENCDPYRVARTTRRGDTLLVAVRGMCTDAGPRPDADVIAQVMRAGTSWQFVNFRYPATHGSLIADLDTLRREREHAGPAPRARRS